MEGSRQEIQPTWKLWTKWDCLTNSLANHIGIDPTVFQLRSSPVSEPPESLGFLSTSHQFSLLGPATNLSLLQMPVVWFVWPQCTLVCLDSCPLSWWCYLIISSFATPFSFCLQSFPRFRVFSNKSALCIRWPKYWSFSSSASNEHSGLISFRIDWLVFFAVQGALKSLLHRVLLGFSISECNCIWT